LIGETDTDGPKLVRAADSERRLFIYLTGDFRVHDRSGRSLLPGRTKAAALLCLLATSRHQMVSRSAAAAMLWSAKYKDTAGQYLRQVLSELKFVLDTCGRPPLMATKHGQLVLQPASIWVDVLEPITPPSNSEFNPSHRKPSLCENLRGLDPSFDAYLDKLWGEIQFRHMLEPGLSCGPLANINLTPQSRVLPVLGNPGSVTSGPGHFSRETTVTVDNLEALDRFPQTFPATAEVATHQLGWKMAVLPFRSVGAPIGYGIALGMAEEVTAALARFRTPRLVATATFWDGSGPAADVLGRCRTYQLDYIVDGTIQVIGDHIRVNVTLLDVVLDFEVVWSARFDGSLNDLFTLQDRIASETVAQIDPELFQRRVAFTATARTKIAAAHHAVLTAIQGIYRLDRAKFVRASGLLLRAIELDPECAAAHAWMAYWGIMAVSQGWADHPRKVTALAGASAERAMILDPQDARAVAIAGHVRGYLLHDVKGALNLHARAIELNPNLPVAWSLSSWSKIYAGDHNTAVRHATMAQSLSPRDPHIFTVEHALMTAHFFGRNLESADVMAEIVLARNPDHASALNVYVAILGHLGRRQEAKHFLTALQTIEPGITVSIIAARPPLRPDDLEFYKAGLIRAGVPT